MYLPENIRLWATAHNTDEAIALAIYNIAEDGDEERMRDSPTDAERATVIERAWSYCDADVGCTLEMQWGVETIHRDRAPLSRDETRDFARQSIADVHDTTTDAEIATLAEAVEAGLRDESFEPLAGEVERMLTERRDELVKATYEDGARGAGSGLTASSLAAGTTSRKPSSEPAPRWRSAGNDQQRFGGVLAREIAVRYIVFDTKNNTIAGAGLTAVDAARTVLSHGGILLEWQLANDVWNLQARKWNESVTYTRAVVPFATAGNEREAWDRAAPRIVKVASDSGRTIRCLAEVGYNDDLVFVRSDAGDGGWSYHTPGASDESIANGTSVPILTGTSRWDEKQGDWTTPTVYSRRLAAAIYAADYACTHAAQKG